MIPQIPFKTSKVDVVHNAAWQWVPQSDCSIKQRVLAGSTYILGLTAVGIESCYKMKSIQS